MPLMLAFTLETVFQSTLPARGATDFRTDRHCAEGFQSTLPARGATVVNAFKTSRFSISIHAPRTGSDADFRTDRHCAEGFQSTLPARGATLTFMDSKATNIFQSTLPARGATANNGLLRFGYRISIHAPRTGSDQRGWRISPAQPISIHAPRTGSDPKTGLARTICGDFNPRSPHGERQGGFSVRTRPCHFNPRSPHGERRSPSAPDQSSCHFNPRSPHGERHKLQVAFTNTHIFQSTLPARGATFGRHEEDRRAAISIHAPRTGSDPAVSVGV